MKQSDANVEAFTRLGLVPVDRELASRIRRAEDGQPDTLAPLGTAAGRGNLNNSRSIKMK
jgi:hypothetical protein